VVFILITLTFTGATIFWALWMASVAIQIRLVLVENVGMELSEKFALTNAAMAKLGLIQRFLNPLMVL